MLIIRNNEIFTCHYNSNTIFFEEFTLILPIHCCNGHCQCQVSHRTGSTGGVRSNRAGGKGWVGWAQVRGKGECVTGRGEDGSSWPCKVTGPQVGGRGGVGWAQVNEREWVSHRYGRGE